VQGQGGCFVNISSIFGSCGSGCNGKVFLDFSNNYQNISNISYYILNSNSNVIGPFAPNPMGLDSLVGLCPDNYNVSVYESGVPCYFTSFTINSSSNITLSSEVSNASCSTCYDGAISLGISGGTAPYAINQNGEVRQSVSDGVETFWVRGPYPHIFTVTDTFGCSISDTITVGVGNNGNFKFSGNIYYDLNLNGIRDLGEPGLPKQRANITGSTSDIETNLDGDFGGIIQTGNYNVSYVPIPGWTLTASSPTSYSISVTSNSIPNLDFGVVPDSIGLGWYVTHELWSPCPSPYFAVNVRTFGSVSGLSSFYPMSYILMFQNQTVNYGYASFYNNFTLYYSGPYSFLMFDHQGIFCGSYTFNLPAYNWPTLSHQVFNTSCPTCQDGSITLSSSNGVEPLNLLLNGISCDSIIDSLSVGTYIATLTDQCGNTDTDTIYVGTSNYGCIKPEPVSLGTSSSTELCPAETVSIKIITPADSVNYTYQWTRNGTNMVGANTRSITVNDVAKYKVFVRSGPGAECQRVSGLIETTSSVPPMVNATAPNGTSLCAGDSVLITAVGGSTGYSYRWKRYGVVIPGTNSNNFYATQTGNYRCEIYNTGGCIAQSNLISITSGISCRLANEVDSDISIHPIPANDIFTVSFNDIGSEVPLSVELWSINGTVIERRKIYDTNDVRFSVINLTPGVYMVRILLESGSCIDKYVVVD